MMKSILKSISFLVFLCGCSDDFNPNGPYEQRLVVYAVMNTGSDTQFVDVYSTTNPDQIGAPDQYTRNEITGASVILHSDSNIFTFHDTAIVVQTGGSFRTVKKFVHYNSRIFANRTYSLSVNCPGFPTASAQFKSFPAGSILPLNTLLFTNSSSDNDLEIDLYFGKGSFAYLARLYVEYERRNNGVWEDRTEEVPLYYDGTIPGYPRIDFVTANNIARKTFKRTVYRQTIAKIRSNPSDTIRINNAVIELQQFDEQLYTYYSIANSFPGGASIRLDEPDYTNVSNGFGIVGVVSKNVYRSKITSLP